MKENWRQIDEYPGYLISDQGRVISLNYRGQGNLKMLEPFERGGGKPSVCINRRNTYVHVLVAKAFVGRPKGATCVIHKNKNYADNRAGNLAWSTMSNVVTNTRKNGQRKNAPKKSGRKKTPVVSYEIATGKRQFFETIEDAHRALNLDRRNIYQVVHGKRNKVGGYTFVAA